MPAAREFVVDRPPLVLIANDQEWSARGLESILAPQGYVVLHAASGRQALDLAASAQPDIVVLDERLPDVRGTRVCQQLRDEGRLAAGTPVILMTADSLDREQVLAAYRAGAWECLVEPFDAEALLLRLHTYVRAKRETDRLRGESVLDGATGLYNRRGLARRAHEIGADAYRRHGAFACVALAPELAGAAPDADGRPATVGDLADQLAAHLGALLRRHSRGSDAVGRLGAAEFGIIAPHTSTEGAVQLIERLQHDLDATPLHVNGERCVVRVRAGYASVADYSTAAVTAEEMLLRAAEALRHVRTERDATSHIRAYDELPARLGS